ncbi:MAG: CHAD domain-containing protein [Cyanobacteriota bacterium]|nr:CHAD domain-containing protein [Cyanobacteriota bacterium]
MVQVESPVFDATVSSGEYAIQLLSVQVQQLVRWQGPVLANRDPEPLHQMRVTMRRLRVTLQQFAPALQLPHPLTGARLAKTARRLGLARDLDVLRTRLQDQLLPQLPEVELSLLKPVIKQLKRERQQAQDQVEDQLKGGSYLGWLSQMQRWLRKPDLTPLALEPLGEALLQWQLGWLAGLYQHPAWRLEALRNDGERDQVHDLRKQIKLARYQLENCKPWLGPRSRRALRDFKLMQELLGELNDLEVLQRAISDQLAGSLVKDLPVLHGLLLDIQSQRWELWRQQALQPGPRGAAQRWLTLLMRDQRHTCLRHQFIRMCSGLQRAVFCDWRAPLVAR